MAVETNIFQLSPSSISKRMVIAWCMKWWWLLALPVLGCFIMSKWNLAWLIVAFAILMLVIPGVLAFVYFNYALRFDVVKKTIPHKIIIKQNKLVIKYEKTEDKWCPIDDIIDFTAIKKIEDDGSAIIIWLNLANYLFIVLPISAFNNKQDAAKAYNLLSINTVGNM